MKWGKWFQNNIRNLIKTSLYLFSEKGKTEEVTISTVFLGIDHGNWWLAKGKPVLWETMIFGGKHDQYQERYTSKTAALKGHKAAVELVNKSLKKHGKRNPKI